MKRALPSSGAAKAGLEKAVKTTVDAGGQETRRRTAEADER